MPHQRQLTDLVPTSRIFCRVMLRLLNWDFCYRMYVGTFKAVQVAFTCSLNEFKKLRESAMSSWIHSVRTLRFAVAGMSLFDDLLLFSVFSMEDDLVDDRVSLFNFLKVYLNFSDKNQIECFKRTTNHFWHKNSNFWTEMCELCQMSNPYFMQ